MITKLLIWWHKRRDHFEAIIDCDSCGRTELWAKAFIVDDWRDEIDTFDDRQPWYALCRKCS